jgi:hypothetical protein
MACLAERINVGASFTLLAGSGVIAVVGAPTVVLSVAGGAVAVASLLGAITSLNALKECFERRDKLADADAVARTVAQLQEQLGELRARFGLG